ncbi:MAG: hypothetical protein ACLSHO_05405 [Dysosmobacter sp.]
MIDQYSRTIDYLRLSVTDLCSTVANTAMPADGVEKGPHGAVLSVEEYGEIARAAVKLGIRKIRLTGGEPLVRRGIAGHLPNAAGHPRNWRSFASPPTAACCRSWQSPCRKPEWTG